MIYRYSDDRNCRRIPRRGEFLVEKLQSLRNPPLPTTSGPIAGITSCSAYAHAQRNQLHLSQSGGVPRP